MMLEDKKSLRIKYRAVRSSIIGRSTKNSKIAELILNSEAYKIADVIFAYWATGSEVDTYDIIDKAFSDNKKVALPKCIDDKGYMEFYYISAFSDLVDGMYGIKEPPVEFLADNFTEKSLCLVPALSFDKKGYRLGYGKGYYDRFLEKFTGVSMGLCFEECLCESLPVDRYDKKVDYIVTNEKIYDIR